MKFYILAGETSGDIHGSEIVREIKMADPKSEIQAMGGPQIQKAGAEIQFDYRDHAIMGFVEVLKNIQKLKKHFKDVESSIRKFQPDHIIMIDFPGFNLRLASKIYKDFNLHYYIAPKAWAWNKKRAFSLAKYFKTVNSILPFEIDFFKNYNVPIAYVGNPSVNQVDTYIQENKIEKKDYIALFPGSRKQEIQRILPVMLAVIRSFPNIDYKISRAPGMPTSVYKDFLEKQENLIEDNYKLLSEAKAALVTSGTATLETALFNIPQVVLYITSPVNYFIAKKVVSLDYISLVNLILDKPAITELIQNECNEKRITEELNSILNGERNESILNDYQQLRKSLGNYPAAKNTIKNILSN